LDKDSVVEERNGSNQTIKQMVWGKRYIDELVQVSTNSNPTGQTTTARTCGTGRSPIPGSRRACHIYSTR
jgi:hypothetical protein